MRRTYVDTYTLAVRLTGNEEDARDVVQEAYLRAWKGIRRFRGDAAFTTWLYRITANASYTLVERRRRRRTTRLDDVDDPIDRRLDAQPDTLAESSAGLGELSVALDQLPPTLRTLVILKDVYGLSHEAIADELDISVAAAKVRLHRGPQAAAGPARRGRDDGKGDRPVRCDDVALLLPEAVDGDTPVALPVQRHVESCLRCQAELAALPPDAARAPAPAHAVPRAGAGCPEPDARRDRRGVGAAGDPVAAHRASGSPTSVRSAVRSPRPARRPPRCSWPARARRRRDARVH